MSVVTWKKRESAPSGPITRLLPFSDHEFLIVPQPRIDNELAIADGIYKYDSIIDNWVKIMDYPRHFLQSSSIHRASIDVDNKIIYICNESKLIEIDLNHKTMTELCDINIGAYPGVFYANNKVHILRALKTKSGCNNHFIFDLKSNELTVHASLAGIRLFPLLYSKKKNGIIAAYAYQNTDQEWMGDIRILKSDNEWESMQGLKSYFFAGAALTTDEDYILLMHRTPPQRKMCYHFVWIYNMQTGSMIKSDIELPCQDHFSSIITRNKKKEDLIVFGFVHKYQEKFGDEFMIIPDYIIQVIGNWVCCEHLHVISHLGQQKRNHWCIDIDTIFKSES